MVERVVFNNPKVQVVKPEPSEVILNPLDQENLQKFQTLLDVIRSSIGPSGTLNMLHNGMGGHVTVTSCSGRLLSNLTVSSPLLQLLLSSVQTHLKQYCDGGLTTLLLSLYLIETASKLDLHKHLLVDIAEEIIELCLKYLSSDGCQSKLEVSLETTEHLMRIVKGVLFSKKCCLSPQDKEYTAKLVVDGFLKTFSEDTEKSFGNLLCMGIEGSCPRESKIVEGVFFQTPNVSLSGHNFPKLQIVTEKRLSLIKVALFTVSLSGDVFPLPKAHYEVKAPGLIEETLLDNLKHLADKIVEDQIGLVLSQKVVHPNLKKYWRQKDVFVLDRLGEEHSRHLMALAGCFPISCLDPESISSDSYGRLTSVEHLVLEEKSYVHMKCEGSPVHTMLLFNLAEEPLQELMHVCKCAREVLYSTLKQPMVLHGNGCWLADLALHIHSKVISSSGMVADKLGCSKQQWIGGATAFMHCLASLASSIDRHSGTLVNWMQQKNLLTDFENAFPVQCTQLLSSETCSNTEPVLDCFPVCCSVLKTAFSAFNMVLSVGVIIEDVN